MERWPKDAGSAPAGAVHEVGPHQPSTRTAAAAATPDYGPPTHYTAPPPPSRRPVPTAQPIRRPDTTPRARRRQDRAAAVPAAASPAASGGHRADGGTAAGEGGWRLHGAALGVSGTNRAARTVTRKVIDASKADGAHESGLTALIWNQVLSYGADAMITVALAGTVFFGASTARPARQRAAVPADHDGAVRGCRPDHRPGAGPAAARPALGDGRHRRRAGRSWR